MQTKKIIIVACVSFVLSMSLTNGQSFPISDNGSVDVHVARPVTILKQFDLDYDWIAPGQTKTTLATDPAAMRFMVGGEAAASFTVEFPLAITLYRLGNPIFPVTIPFTRGSVYTNSAQNQAGAVPFLTPLVLSGSHTLPGALGQLAQPQYRWFWIGGSITAPSVIPPDYYEGVYTVSVTAYWI